MKSSWSLKMFLVCLLIKYRVVNLFMCSDIFFVREGMFLETKTLHLQRPIRPFELSLKEHKNHTQRTKTSKWDTEGMIHKNQ